MDEIREIYLAGYAAFEDGDFPRAVLLASRCLQDAPPGSYWHSGALGLRCWARGWLGDDVGVKEDAEALLRKEGPDREWFTGLALFNLALMKMRGVGRGRRAGCSLKRRIGTARTDRWRANRPSGGW